MSTNLKIRMGHVRHVQELEAEEWVIDHGMGSYPTVSVFISLQGKLETILPKEIEHPTVNQTIIRFSRPRSGEARLV